MVCLISLPSQTESPGYPSYAALRNASAIVLRYIALLQHCAGSSVKLETSCYVQEVFSWRDLCRLWECDGGWVSSTRRSHKFTIQTDLRGWKAQIPWVYFHSAYYRKPPTALGQGQLEIPVAGSRIWGKCARPFLYYVNPKINASNLSNKA